jgi:hypothetical protein
MKESDISNARSLINQMSPRFSIVRDPKANPIPAEISLYDALKEIDKGMQQGWNLNPPAMVDAAGAFTGMQLLLTDRNKAGPNGKPAIRMSVGIHTDLEDQAVMTDQNLIGYAIMAIVFSSFLARAKAEQEKKDAELLKKATEEAEGNITKFPGPEVKP